MKVQQAVQLLQEALPQVPMGTPLHTKLIKVVSEMTKELGDVKANMQQQVQTLMQHMQQQKAAGQQMPPSMAPQPNQPPAMVPPGAPAGMAA